MKKYIFGFILYCLLKVTPTTAQFYMTTDFEFNSPSDMCENAVFINSINNNKIIIANNYSSKSGGGPQNGIGVFKSDDAGINWAGHIITFNSYADPSVAIDNAGNYYLMRITLLMHETSSYKFNDTDFPYTTLNPPWTDVIVENSNDGPDKCSIWIDNNINSPNYNNIYYAYAKIYSANPPSDVFIKISNTTNFASIGNEILLSSISSYPAQVANHSPILRTSKTGHVYGCWVIYDNPLPSDETGIGFASLDPTNLNSLQSKRIPLTIRGTRGTGLIGNSGNNIIAAPSIAVNQQNDHIYIVWTNQGLPGTNQNTNPSYVDPDIYFIKSIDGGLNWSVPTRINQDGAGNNNYYASIACDPVTGTIAVIYYDSRDYNTSERVYVALSDNDGDTWSEFPVSDDPSNGAPYINSGASIGADYIGIDINKNLIVPVWSNNSSSTYITYTSPFSIACDVDVNANCNQDINTIEFLKADNSVTIAGDPITCYYNVLSNVGDVTAYAGNYVKIQKGFHAESGSSFHAFIRHCNVFNDATSTYKISPFQSYNNPDIVVNKLNPNDIFFSVYPNPYKDILTIKGNESIDKITVHLFDSYGNLVFKFDNNSISKNDIIKIDLEYLHLNSGLYFLKIITGNKTEIKKLCKR